MIRIASIEPESTIDGEGWRYVIFTQGCNHNCKGCHNPQTHDFNSGKLVSDSELISQIQENPLLDGITLSGGDPFFQAENIINLAKQCKDLGLTVWAYTGFIFEDFLNFKNNCKTDSRINQAMLDLLQYIDVVVDGRFILEQKTLDSKYIGSKNQRIIDVKESINKNTPVLYKLN